VYRSRTITVSIRCPHRQVYDFLSEPLNLPTWAAAVERIEHRRDNDWTAHTIDGEFVIRYTPRNEFGILDYSVFRPDDPNPYVIPQRVVANGDGAELIMVHYQRPGMTDELFQSEAEWMEADFLIVKTVMEARSKT
jgi:hypothetical protein